MWRTSVLIIWRTIANRKGICGGRHMPARIFPASDASSTRREHASMINVPDNPNNNVPNN